MIEFLKQINKDLRIVHGIVSKKKDTDSMQWIFSIKERLKDKIKELENED